VAGDGGLALEAWEVGTDSDSVSSAPQQRGRAGDVRG
jgi:hypothetical protein